MTERSPSTPNGVLATIRSLPRIIRLITVLWFAVLLTWSIVLPTFRSADEFAHVAGAEYWEYQHSWPDFYGDIGSPAVMKSLPHVEYDHYRPLAAAKAPGAMPSFADLGDRSIVRGHLTIGQHPPGYYVLIGTVAGLIPDTAPFDLEVWLLRLVSVLLLTPLPLLVAATARQFTRSRRTLVAASVIPFVVPQLGALGGSVNNDNLLIVAASVVTLGVAGLARGDTGLRTAAWTGGALAVALLTKAFALVLLPIVLVALLVAWSRGGRRMAPSLRSAGMVGLLSLAGLWWWIRNLLIYGSVQPAGHFPARPGGPMDIVDAVRQFARSAVILVPQRFWSMVSIKGRDQAFPLWFYLTLTVLAVGVVVAGLAWRRRYHRIDRLLLISPLVLVGLLTTYSTFMLTVKTGKAAGLQGRYLYVGFVGLAVLLALGGARLLHRRSTLLPVLTGVAGAVFTAASLRRALGYHWERRDSGLWEGVRALLAWSPLGRTVTTIVLAATALLALLVLVMLALQAFGRFRFGDGRRPHPDAAGDRSPDPATGASPLWLPPPAKTADVPARPATSRATAGAHRVGTPHRGR